MLSFGYSALRTAAVATAVIFGSSAFAATVSCPGTAVTTDREFGLTTAVAAKCLTSGSSNINGNGDAINNFVWLGATFLTVDKSDTDDTLVGVNGEIDISGVNSSSGDFTLTLPAGYKNFVLALKSGNNLDPVWVAFLLAPGTTGGHWTISDQGLSHALLYAQPDENVSENPIPGALWLFGTVIAGGAGYSRWRKKRKQAA